MVEACNKKMQFIVNPIIEWADKDIWDYIKVNKIPYCSLYDEGFKRLGCVLCPMAAPRITKMELVRFPKIVKSWRNATEQLYESHKDRDSFKHWKSSEELWQWWISRETKRAPEEQCQMFLGDN
jgi:phosphoadenosine phosphosulfate reductase